jgi:hypothetical protein
MNAVTRIRISKSTADEAHREARQGYNLTVIRIADIMPPDHVCAE